MAGGGSGCASLGVGVRVWAVGVGAEGDPGPGVETVREVARRLFEERWDRSGDGGGLFESGGELFRRAAEGEPLQVRCRQATGKRLRARSGR